MMPKPRAYLAGPTVFLPDAAARFAEMRRVCIRAGLMPVTPLDGEPAVLLSGPDTARRIREANIAKIRSARVVLADVGPFRGPNADDGTAWEMGYAEALGKPVIPYTADSRTYLERAVWFLGAVKHLEGAPWKDLSDQAIEDFGLACNLMLAAGAVPVQVGLAQAAEVAARLVGAQNKTP